MAITSFTSPVSASPRRPQGRVLDVPAAVRKVALLGFGTVGSAVAEILCSKTFPQLQLTYIFNRNVARKRQPWVPSDVRWTDKIEDVLTSDADVVVELMGGLDPAGEWLELVLRAGKCVVTANKHLIATRGRELARVAHQYGRRLEYGASVAGGVPVLNAVAAGLAGDPLLRLQGVLNGTCNYILSNMDAQGLSFEDALQQAQALGYAEADPSDDVNGVDAACKLAILAQTSFGLSVTPQQIFARSILGITAEDFQQARKRALTIRQVSSAERTKDGLRLSVQPTMVRSDAPLGQVRDNQNVLVTTGQWGGETIFAGRGAGGGPTAVAVVSDLLAVARHHDSGAPRVHFDAPDAKVESHFVRPHYVRVRSADFGQVLPALQRVGIEVEESSRPSRWEKVNGSAFAFVRDCTTGALESALKELGSGSWVCLPIRR
jgi:homoserine dehydrogenase